MCVITISLALCDTTCPYPSPDVPAGCLKIYPFTSTEINCPKSESVLGSCGKVEMVKDEGRDGSRIGKRICESCVAWFALMRDKDGKWIIERRVSRVRPEDSQDRTSRSLL